MEAELLRHLIRKSGKIVSRKSILEEVWGLHEDTDTRAIDNFIVRLRKYIEKDPSHPQHSVDGSRSGLSVSAHAAAGGLGPIAWNSRAAEVFLFCHHESILVGEGFASPLFSKLWSRASKSRLEALDNATCFWLPSKFQELNLREFAHFGRPENRLKFPSAIAP